MAGAQGCDSTTPGLCGHIQGATAGRGSCLGSLWERVLTAEVCLAPPNTLHRSFPCQVAGGQDSFQLLCRGDCSRLYFSGVMQGGVEELAPHLIPTLTGLRSGCTSHQSAAPPQSHPVNSAWAESPDLPGTRVSDQSLSLTLDHHIRLGNSCKSAVEGIYFTGS